MATKPLVEYDWANQLTTAGPSGNPNREEPTQAIKDFGQAEAGPIDRQSLNYQLYSIGRWLDWAEKSVDALEESTEGSGIWIVVDNSSTDLTLKREYLVLNNTNNVDLSLPSSLIAGNTIRVYNPKQTTNNTVRIVNNNHTLIGNSKTLSSSDNLILEAGYYVEIIPSGVNTAYLRITPMEL